MRCLQPRIVFHPGHRPVFGTVAIHIERIVTPVQGAKTNHVGDPAELVELGQALLAQAHAVDDDQAFTVPYHDHVAAELPVHPLENGLHGAADEKHVGKDLFDGAMG